MRLLAAGGLICLVILFGTAGYMIIERWGFWDSFYITVITLTTVGYREVYEMSQLAGHNLDQCGIGRELGIIIVAIKQANGEMKFNPNFLTVIEPGDTLIAVGEASKLKMLENMAKLT